MRYHLLILLAFLTGSAVTYLVVRSGEPQAQSSSVAVRAEAEQPDVLPLSIDRPTAEADRASRHEVAAAAEDPPQKRKIPSDAPMTEASPSLDGSDAFPNAARLMADPEYNPQRKAITTEQRRELQRLLDQANAKARELQQAISIEVEAHSWLLVARGQGRALLPGEKATKLAPEHDSLSIISDGSGASAVSFTRHDVPRIAVYMDAREDLLRQTEESIKNYFLVH